MMRGFGCTVAVIIVAACIGPVHAGSNVPQFGAACRVHASEAAVRSGLAVDVILRVMQAESAGKPGVLSIKGAMGCMQIMPATWTYLSGRFGLGSNPYDARMNMIGGAMYLSELAHRFGWPGAYAAYNAGPGRYSRFAANGVPLPPETVAYATRLGGAAAPANAAIERSRWQEARLFLVRSKAAESDSEDDTSAASHIREETIAQPISPGVASTSSIVSTLFPFATR